MKILIRHEQLKRLREGRNIPFEEMSRKLKVTRDEYTKLESTDNEVDEVTASKIAGVLKYNWSVFLLDSRPDFSIKPVDNRTFENRRSTLGKKTIIAIEESSFILSYSQELPNKEGINLPEFKDIENDSPEIIAKKIRSLTKISVKDQERFKDDSHALKNWIGFVENLGIFVSQYSLDIDDQIRAFSLLDKDSAIIVLNTSDIFSARAFSLIHELGHIIRRGSGMCDLHSSLNRDVETFCNRFAAEFLAPAEVVEEIVKQSGRIESKSDLETVVSKITKTLKISKLAVYRRLTTLGVISSGDYQKIHNKYNFLKQIPIDPSKQKKSGGANYYKLTKQKNGELYSNKVFEAYDAGLLTFPEVGNALGVSIKNIDKYRSWPAQGLA